LSVHKRPDWSVAAGRWAVEAVRAGVPTLGVCYGHQLLGDALDGDVGPNPNGREMGTLAVELLDADEPLFEGLGGSPKVVLTHSDAVNVAPEGARIIARSDWTPVQAMAIGKTTRTVQWHPEFDADIIAIYIQQRAHLIDAEFEPGTAKRWLEAVVENDTGPRLLRNWVAHYFNR
ncbi:MAG: glutamine amidotransferase, partial [bacterium]|nr:glutamine amidotransferase [bacterium]